MNYTLLIKTKFSKRFMYIYKMVCVRVCIYDPYHIRQREKEEDIQRNTRGLTFKY